MTPFQYLQILIIFSQMYLILNLWTLKLLTNRYNSKFENFSNYVNLNENYIRLLFTNVFLFINIKKTDEKYKHLYLTNKHKYLMNSNSSKEERDRMENDFRVYERSLKIMKIQKKTKLHKFKNILKIS